MLLLEPFVEKSSKLPQLKHFLAFDFCELDLILLLLNHELYPLISIPPEDLGEGVLATELLIHLGFELIDSCLDILDVTL